ncbi:MAG TPA: Fic family protein [Steroidobacteraceae bacterium]|nr:Fic family protein [Steroidobacteraceae bacterium]
MHAEGHDTHPVDIERALQGDYSHDAKKRALQLEATAHIAVQQRIDEGGLKGRAFTIDGIRETHHRFCTGHIAISPGAVPRFLERFDAVYSNLGKAETILAAAANHHRLAWIHPFLDGNGRVACLISHSTLLDALDTGAVWSVARALARSVADYKDHLASCDQTRCNDLDDRGNLSDEALAGFTRFFLATCIDQVKFMESLMQPGQLRARILLWAKEEVRLNRLPPKSGTVLEALLYRGELPRGDAAGSDCQCPNGRKT